MKKLYLVRHAKSSWKDGGVSDIKRPLNSRGKHDAPFMGELLHKRDVNPEVIVSSDAERAFTTAKIIADKLNYPPEKIVNSHNLYLADVNELMEYIAGLDNSYDSAMLVGHNPGVTLLLNYLTGSEIDNMATCSTACIDLKIDSWPDVKEKSGKLMFFEYPKKYQE